MYIQKENAMNNYSRVKIVTTEKGFDFIEQAVDQAFAQENSHLTLDKWVSYTSRAGGLVILSWACVRWLKFQRDKAIGAAVTAVEDTLDSAIRKNFPFDFTRVGDDGEVTERRTDLNLELPPVRVEQEIFVDTRDEFCPLEDKQAVCDQLCKALQLTNGFSHIASIIYDEKSEKCRIHFAHGFRDVNVAMDSGEAMIRDIIRALNR